MKNKNYIHHMSYLRNSVAYNHGFWGTFVKLCYLQVFFSFFQKLIFQVVRGVKGQKKVQNDKEFCLSRSISQEPYSIWLSFMVHLCNMIISLDVFFFFFFNFLKIFVFWGVCWVRGQKMVQNDKKFVYCAPYLRNQTHMIVIYGAHV